MNLIIAGGRDFTDLNFMYQGISSITELSELKEAPTLICGMARGADLTAYEIWSWNQWPTIEMPADWGRYGRSAGYRRNAEMAAVADALIAFWDGQSKGTKHMIETMQKLNKPVWIFNY